MWVSACNTSIRVALYAPAMTRKHLFCMTSSLLLDSTLVFFLASAGMCHAIEPCDMAGRITAVYTWRARRRVAPQVEAAILVSAILCLVIFF